MSVTTEFRLTCAPAAGFVPIAVPLGTVSLVAGAVTICTGIAAGTGPVPPRPVTSTVGSVNRSLPAEIVSATALPRAARDPAAGSVATTSPLATVSLNAVSIGPATR